MTELTEEMKAQGWRENLHIDKSPKDGIFQTAYFNCFGELQIRECLISKKEAIASVCRFDTYRILQPLAPDNGDSDWG